MAITEEYERKITNASNKELAEEIKKIGQKLDYIRIELIKRKVEGEDAEIKQRAQIRLLTACYFLQTTAPALVAAIKTIEEGEYKE